MHKHTHYIHIIILYIIYCIYYIHIIIICIIIYIVAQKRPIGNQDLAGLAQHKLPTAKQQCPTLSTSLHGSEHSLCVCVCVCVVVVSRLSLQVVDRESTDRATVALLARECSVCLHLHLRNSNLFPLTKRALWLKKLLGSKVGALTSRRHSVGRYMEGIYWAVCTQTN